MAYTVDQAYTRVLQEADKMGSDYFSLPVVLARFKKVTLDFVGARAKEVEKTQEVTNDIEPLVTIKAVGVVPDPVEASCWNAPLPNDYHTRLNAIVQYTSGKRSVRPTFERIGEHNYNQANPFKNAAPDYPLIKQMSNYFEIFTGGAIPNKFFLTYIKQPTFGIDGGSIMINLPDQVAEHLFELTATDLFISTGDPRGNTTFQTNQSYRKKN